MTTIAYHMDPKTGSSQLAADCLMRYGNHNIITTKIVQLCDGSWFAQAGESLGIQRFLDWYNSGGAPENRPSPCGEGTSFQGIQVTATPIGTDQFHLRVTLWSDDYCGEEVPFSGTYALGSGGDLVLGALGASATLIEAIRIASRHDASTGLQIQVVDLPHGETTFWPIEPQD